MACLDLLERHARWRKVEVEARLVSFAESEVIVEDFGLEAVDQRLFDRTANITRESVLGKDDMTEIPRRTASSRTVTRTSSV